MINEQLEYIQKILNLNLSIVSNKNVFVSNLIQSLNVLGEKQHDKDGITVPNDNTGYRNKAIAIHQRESVFFEHAILFSLSSNCWLYKTKAMQRICLLIKLVSLCDFLLKCLYQFRKVSGPVYVYQVVSIFARFNDFFCYILELFLLWYFQISILLHKRPFGGYVPMYVNNKYGHLNHIGIEVAYTVLNNINAIQ